MPSKVRDGEERGWIIPIGGAEEKENDPRILKRFVDLCGGDKADIVVLPTASRLLDTGPRYEHIFVNSARPRTRRSTTTRAAIVRRKADLDRLARATGIFFTAATSCASPPYSAARRSPS